MLSAEVDEEGSSPPQEDWLSDADRARFDELLAKLLTSTSKDTILRCYAKTEGYLLGLWDCNHISEHHHHKVKLYVHEVAMVRLDLIKARRGG